ncbi:MAG: retropepsin-like aspartic protease, partial [Chloroherpetonaceae bacterium]|nr:retropepsin-like aspartic protease [Chloroherpetonaceae bacterium]
MKNRNRKEYCLKLWSFFLLITLGSISAFSQKVDYNQGSVVQTNFYSEMPYESINGKIIITAELGGKKRRFLIDTGSLCAITEVLQSEMKYPILTESTVRDINEQSTVLKYIALDKFQFANTEFNRIPAVVFPQNILSDCFKIDGILGSNLFRLGLLQFNSQKKTIIFTGERSKLNLEGKPKDELKLDEQSGPHIRVDLANGIQDEA